MQNVDEKFVSMMSMCLNVGIESYLAYRNMEL